MFDANEVDNGSGAAGPPDEVSRRRFFVAAGSAGAAAGILALGGPVSSAEATMCGADCFNVNDYGAKGDGETDDSAAIQSAINAAKAVGGGVVTGFSGRFRVDSGLTLYDHICLLIGPSGVLDFSTSSSSQLISAAGSDGEPAALVEDAALGATSLKVTEGAQGNYAAGDLIRVGSEELYDPDRSETLVGEHAYVLSTEPGRINLRSPLVGGPYKTANNATLVKVTPVERPEVVGSGQIWGPGPPVAQVGIDFDRARFPVIDGIRIKGAHGCGINWKRCIGGHCINPVVEDSYYATSGYGVNIGGGSEDCKVFGGFTRNCRHGLSVGGSTVIPGVARRLAFIAHTTIESTGDAHDTHGGCEDVHFIDGTVYDAGGSGVNVECAKASVRGYTINRTSSHGISAHNETTQSTEFNICGNKLRNTTGRAITVQDGNSGGGTTHRAVSVIGNQIDEISNIGILVRGLTKPLTGVRVSDNILCSVQSTIGILLQNIEFGSCTGNVLTKSAPTMTGIRYVDCRGVPCQGNTVGFASKSTGVGVRAGGASVACPIGPNVVEKANVGVLLESTVSGCSILGGDGFTEVNTPYSLSTGSNPASLRGSGTPESKVTACVGSIWQRTDGGPDTTLYVKESGTGNTGWTSL